MLHSKIIDDEYLERLWHMREDGDTAVASLKASLGEEFDDVVVIPVFVCGGESVAIETRTAPCTLEIVSAFDVAVIIVGRAGEHVVRIADRALPVRLGSPERCVGHSIAFVDP